MKEGIRALQREDVPAVAGLYELVMRSGSGTPAPGLADYFERTLLDHPWADPQIPSLVYAEAEGKITGFIGSHVRRFRLDGQPIRLACGGQLVADPDARRKAVGALLMQRYLAGPQDLTITDTASLPTHAMWPKLKGKEVSLGCISWTRLFRPLRFSADRTLPERGMKFTGPVWSTLDSVTNRIPRR
jgi:GNAT superfamily N-acetyltransferase